MVYGAFWLYSLLHFTCLYTTIPKCYTNIWQYRKNPSCADLGRDKFSSERDKKSLSLLLPLRGKFPMRDGGGSAHEKRWMNFTVLRPLFPSIIAFHHLSAVFLDSSQSLPWREIYGIHLKKKISSLVSSFSSCTGDVFPKWKISVPGPARSWSTFNLFLGFYVTPSTQFDSAVKSLSCLQCSFNIKHQRTLICLFKSLFCIIWS